MPATSASSTAPPRLQVVPPAIATWPSTSGPMVLPVEKVDAAAEIVALAGDAARPRGARVLGWPEVGAYARGVGRPVVVVSGDTEAAAAVAERLAALGVRAGWLQGGIDAWRAAGRPVDFAAGGAA